MQFRWDRKGRALKKRSVSEEEEEGKEEKKEEEVEMKEEEAEEERREQGRYLSVKCLACKHRTWIWAHRMLIEKQKQNKQTKTPPRHGGTHL